MLYQLSYTPRGRHARSRKYVGGRSDARGIVPAAAAVSVGSPGGRIIPVRSLFESWQAWALLSAFFAALTAIFAKVGIAGVGSDFATFVRTVVILAVLAAILTATGQWQSPGAISWHSLAFLVLSGLATGASWICYFRALKIGEASRVAPIDKLSVVLVAVFGVAFLGDHLSRTHWLAIAMIACGAILLARG